MNIDYRQYHFEDFASDESFRKWIIDHDATSTAFWQQWLLENPDCTEKVQLATSFLYALGEKNTALSTSDLDAITESIVHKQTVAHPFRLSTIWHSTIWRTAAIILLLFGVGWLVWRYTQPDPFALDGYVVMGEDCVGKENTLNSPIRFNLEDGSEVTLYPKSKLCFPKAFAASKREVYLSGHAFFKVKKAAERPFWVYTQKITTQVLGTSFSVKSFRGTEDAKVEVKTGKVTVYTRQDLEYARKNKGASPVGVVLTPNQEVSYAPSQHRLIKSLVAKPETLVPVKPQAFKFDEAPIDQVFTLLEEIYGVKMIYDAKMMDGCYLTTDLTDESLYEKLDLISKITHSNYEIVEAQVIVHSKGCPVPSR